MGHTEAEWLGEGIAGGGGGRDSYSALNKYK